MMPLMEMCFEHCFMPSLWASTIQDALSSYIVNVSRVDVPVREKGD